MRATPLNRADPSLTCNAVESQVGQSLSQSGIWLEREPKAERARQDLNL